MIREIIEGEKKDKIKKNQKTKCQKIYSTDFFKFITNRNGSLLRNSVKLITGLSSTRNTIFFFPCFLLDDTYKHNKFFIQS